MRGNLRLELLHYDLLCFRLHMEERDSPYTWALFVCHEC